MEVHAFGIDLGTTNYIAAEAWGKQGTSKYKYSVENTCETLHTPEVSSI